MDTREKMELVSMFKKELIESIREEIKKDIQHEFSKMVSGGAYSKMQSSGTRTP